MRISSGWKLNGAHAFMRDEGYRYDPELSALCLNFAGPTAPEIVLRKYLVTDQELKEIPPKTVEDPSSDLGFGRVVSEQRQLRLLNRDGSFNVQKTRPWAECVSGLLQPGQHHMEPLLSLCRRRVPDAQWLFRCGLRGCRTRRSGEHPRYRHTLAFPEGFLLQHSHFGNDWLWKHCAGGLR